jgi:hypothetical protein
MAGIAPALAGFATERFRNTGDIAFHNIDKTSFPGGFEVSDRGFDQVAAAIELMLIPQVAPAVFSQHEAAKRIQIAVCLLGCGQQVNHFINALFQLFIGAGCQPAGSCFQPFGQIRIQKTGTLVGFSGRKATIAVCGQAQVAQAVRWRRIRQVIVQSPPLVGDHGRERKIAIITPETFFNLYLLQGYRLCIFHHRKPLNACWNPSGYGGCACIRQNSENPPKAVDRIRQQRPCSLYSEGLS